MHCKLAFNVHRSGYCVHVETTSVTLTVVDVFIDDERFDYMTMDVCLLSAGCRTWRHTPRPAPSSHSASTFPKVGRKVAPSTNTANHTPRKPGSYPPGSVVEYLMVNITRTPPGTTELAPFKIVTKVCEYGFESQDVLWLLHFRQ